MEGGDGDDVLEGSVDEGSDSDPEEAEIWSVSICRVLVVCR